MRVGFEILGTMPALNARLSLQARVRVAARIGIHTGRVVAGTIGGGSRTEQLAVGATPNMAARIHGLATPDAVLISATTHRLVHGYFICEDLGTHALKGVADPMPVARALGHTTAQSRLEVVGATAPARAELFDVAGHVRRPAQRISQRMHGTVFAIFVAMIAARRPQTRRTGWAPYQGSRILWPFSRELGRTGHPLPHAHRRNGPLLHVP